tara:strand:+ start:23781 stop:25883 length:2103 start_codon:yes stop_codon:yes gene_type:complete
MDYKKEIADFLAKKLQVPLATEELSSKLEIPKKASMGDYAFPCFFLAKEWKKAPAAIASDLAAKIDELPAFISQVQATGPYLNFYLNKASLAADLIPKILSGQYLSARPSTKVRTMIEFSQPNTHKGFHVGHTRNVSLGDSLVQLRKWLGDEVIAANYIGDVGAHIAKVLWYYTTHKVDYEDYQEQMSRGEFLGMLYSKAVQALDFNQLTKVPLLNVLTTKVQDIQPHPKNAKWKLVSVAHKDKNLQIVCGATGFEVGSIVALAIPGARVLGRTVEVSDKQGTQSEGMLCSAKELGLGEDNENLYVFPADTPLGMEVADYFSIQGENASQEMRKREQGVSEVLQKLEKEEGEIYDLWLKTKEWSMQDFYEIYNWLNVHFDHYFYESEVAEPGKKLVQEYTEKGLFKKDEGAIGIDLSEYKLPFFLVLKSDGTGLYSTKDLALAQLKIEKYKVDRSIYVVAAEQNLHFQQVFKTLELMGYEQADKCYHLSYGMVVGPEGKLSSRKGNVVLLNEHRKLLAKQIYEDFLKNYEGKWSKDEIAEAIRKISIATIKYGMLNQDSHKNIVFDLKEWTARSGNTGPYLLYAYARTQSILREVDDKYGFDAAKVSYDKIEHPSEEKVLNKIAAFPETMTKAAERYEPQIVCIYLYELAKDFSRMYDQCSVLNAENDVLRNTRRQLVAACGAALKAGLHLIGIESLDRM